MGNAELCLTAFVEVWHLKLFLF